MEKLPGDSAISTERPPDPGADVPALAAPDAPLLERLLGGTNEGDHEFGIFGVDFSHLDLRGATFTSTQIEACAFDRADLTGAQFTEATIQETSFLGANLSQAKFATAQLFDVDFTEATLEAADFRGADLEQVNVDRAILKQAVFEYGDVNLLDASDVRGMDISAVDDESMEPRDRLTLYQRGARVHSGIRCPRCARWDGYEHGLEPNCPRCWGVGFIDPDDVDFEDDDEEEEFEKRLMPCPWCRGSGSQTGAMSSWACPVCDGDGDVEHWAVDLEQVREHIDGNDWENMEAAGFPHLTIANVDFEYESFSGGRFENVIFERCDFRNASFNRMVLHNVGFVSCTMWAGDFRGARLTNVEFERCHLEASKWEGAMAMNVLVNDTPATSASDVLTVWRETSATKGQAPT